MQSTKLSIEELLEALKNDQAEVSFDDLDSVSQFFYSFSIQTGSERVSSKLLHELYKCWTTKPVTFKKFNQFVKEEFEYSHKNGLFFIQINVPSSFIRIAIKKEKNCLTNRKFLKISRSQVEKVIDYYNIQPGKFYLEARCLFYLYDSWCYDRKKKTIISEESFYRFCELYFSVKNTRYNKYFMVHPSIKLHITPQVRAEIKQGILRAQKGKKNKAK